MVVKSNYDTPEELNAGFWGQAFKELIYCPDCKKRKLFFVENNIVCGNCSSKFDYKNGVPHLYTSNFRALIQKLEEEEGASLTEEAAVLKANLEFHNENAGGYDQDPAIHHLLSKSGQALIQDCINYCRNNTEGQIWVDAGCGTGQLMSIGDKFPLTVGFDLSESMAVLANSKGHFVFLGDAYSSPFDDNTADMVTACAVLHHLPKPEEFLKEAYRILKPGGMLFTDFDPNNRPSHNSWLLNVVKKLYQFVKRKEKSMHTANAEVEKQSKLADFQMYYNHNFNGEFFEEALRETGFQEIRVNYYFDKPGLNASDRPAPFKFFRRLLMSSVSNIFNWKELAPYFLILAKK
jgi:ubiquinone/menaquinone biosynthesis C-methylase UbiE/uncharacterized protein YbaR (Trm112 family)